MYIIENEAGEIVKQQKSNINVVWTERVDDENGQPLQRKVETVRPPDGFSVTLEDNSVLTLRKVSEPVSGTGPRNLGYGPIVKVDGEWQRPKLRGTALPPKPDPEPTLVVTEAWTEVVPAVMEGEVEVTSETTIEHAAVTEPNPAYNYTDLRMKEYPTINELVVALWESVMESRPEAANVLEAKRQATKTKYPKV
jgi:hypothetical protein